MASSLHVPPFQNGNLLPARKSSDLQSKDNSDPATLKDTTIKDHVQVPPIKEPSAVINTEVIKGPINNGVDALAKPGINCITSNVPERNQKNLPKVSTVSKNDKQEPRKESVSIDDGNAVNQSPISPTTSMTKSVEQTICDKLEKKSRKLMKHPAIIACFARNMLFLHTLGMQKNKKFNKAKKKRLASFEADNMGTGDQASTSAYSNGHAVIKEQKSHKRKRPKSSKLKNREDLLATGVLKEDLKSISSELAHANADQSKINQAVDLPANNIVIKESEGSKRCESYSLLMQGLKETSVPSWDDIELPKIKTQDAESSKPKSIGYVLNEWDEEYDRGRRKKVKQSKVDFGGPNPFQEIADINNKKKMWKLKTGSFLSGNKPFRN